MIFGKLAQKNKTTNPEAYEAYRSRLIEKLVERRYSPKQEISILRQKDTKPEEFQAYFNYVEECKLEVKKALGEIN